MKKNNNIKDRDKYAGYGLSIGLLAGTNIAFISSMYLGKNMVNFLGFGASFGMLFGLGVGATIDYEIKKNNNLEKEILKTEKDNLQKVFYIISIAIVFSIAISLIPLLFK